MSGRGLYSVCVSFHSFPQKYSPCNCHCPFADTTEFLVKKKTEMFDITSRSTIAKFAIHKVLE